MHNDKPDTEPDAATALRQLALVDRVIGLEAELAHLRSVSPSANIEHQIRQVKQSATWKVGRAVLAPFSAVKLIATRLRRS